MRTGPLNHLLDVTGLSVGHADDARLRSGVTVVIPDEAAIAAVHVMGGAPGTRDTDLLAPEQTVERVDALVLSGGSAFGLDAASGVQAALRAEGRGYAVGSARVPIVPAAILFDLLNGGDKAWGRYPPYRDLGDLAARTAGRDARIGSIGAGFGATTATTRGGLGSASAVLADGTTVAALVAVNAVGSPLIGSGPHFWAAPFEVGDEFGGLGLPLPWPSEATTLRLKGTRPVASATPGAATTIAIVATDAALTKAQAKRMAVMAHDGLARAIFPAHTPLDGDLVFALSTARRSEPRDVAWLAELGVGASLALARAVARGIFAASATSREPAWPVPAWAERFGRVAHSIV